MPEKLLRVIEVAQHLNLSRSNIYQIMDRGDLPYVKFGKARRIRPEDVARLIEQRTVGPG